MSKSNNNNVQFDLSLSGFRGHNGIFSRVAAFVDNIKKDNRITENIDIQIHFKDDDQVSFWIDIFKDYMEVTKFNDDEIVKTITFKYEDNDELTRAFDLATDLVYNDFN